MRFFVVLALLGVALAGGKSSYPYPPVDTRDGCPPAGYTAISGSMRLDNLPPYGKYAICLTPNELGQVLLGGGDRQLFNFTWNGVFRLTQSVLIVDQNVRIDAVFPSTIEWNGATVTSLPGDPIVDQDGTWAGLRLFGSPSSLPAGESYYYKNKKYGNCGTLNKVDLEGMAIDLDAFTLANCSGATKLNEVNVFHTIDPEDVSIDGIGDCVAIKDSTQLIFTDLVVISTGDSVNIQRSEAAFVRPFLISLGTPVIDINNFGFNVYLGSNITVCDPTVHSTDNNYNIGDNQDDDMPSSVAVAGRPNSHFPQDIFFTSNGGILYTLKKCPSKFASGYEMQLWQQWWTTTDETTI